ncbi:uncharacterized protein LOC108039333 [Drosophila rhopaloa]|uniref:Uncharacterized protein LOC108039333 n=1 Tax=Drosophila rhopaloa TaxID=1041015 RepID=A0A6P4E998_DRORH|nr:uncharacterized protein LOC108039333 [Drosophila rhopaloa]
MSDYSKFLANLTDQLGLLPGLSTSGFSGLGGLGNLGNLSNLGNNLGNLRPAHKALMCVGAATVACVVLGLTVKSLKGRGRKDDKRGIIKVRNGAPIKLDLEGADMDDGNVVPKSH